MIVTLADYRRITGDTTSYDGDVTQALNDASTEFTNRTGRIIELGTYSEILDIYDTGKVYPMATPIMAVTDPAGLAFDDIAIQIYPDWTLSGPGSATINYGAYGPYGGGYNGGYGGGVAYGTFGSTGAGVLTGMDRRGSQPQAQVTYSGGYATPPPDVVRCVCEMAVYAFEPGLQPQPASGDDLGLPGRPAHQRKVRFLHHLAVIGDLGDRRLHQDRPVIPASMVTTAIDVLRQSEDQQFAEPDGVANVAPGRPSPPGCGRRSPRPASVPPAGPPANRSTSPGGCTATRPTCATPTSWSTGTDRPTQWTR